MKKQFKKYKQEKGAITLFILLVCIFFVFVLAGIYIVNLTKIQIQDQQVKQIQENYARGLDRQEEIYEETK